MNAIAHRFGNWLTRYLSKENRQGAIGTPTDVDKIRACIQPADVILVEGHTRFATAIKYLSQSTWSHTAIYLGTVHINDQVFTEQFVEADVAKGVVRNGLDQLEGYHTRICRPIGLSAEDVETIKAFALSKVGGTYDLRNVFDLVRFMLPVLPMPERHRMRALKFGSGDPTRAVCSTLIAECFAQINYPIKPKVRNARLSQQHHTLFTPRDFDVSPYFKVIKPTSELGFDYRRFVWNRPPQ